MMISKMVLTDFTFQPVVMAVALFFVRESPYWLASKGQLHPAHATFCFPAEHQNNCCFHHIFNISSLTWLSLSDKLEEAAASLQWSRGPNFDIQPELEEILKRRSKQYFQSSLNICISLVRCSCSASKYS